LGIIIGQTLFIKSTFEKHFSVLADTTQVQNSNSISEIKFTWVIFRVTVGVSRAAKKPAVTTV